MKHFILTDQGSGIVEKRLSSLSEASCSKSAKTCTVKVTDIPLDEGNIEVVASFERDGVGCFATPFPPTTDQTLDPDEISKVPVYEKTLIMDAKADLSIFCNNCTPCIGRSHNYLFMSRYNALRIFR